MHDDKKKVAAHNYPAIVHFSGAGDHRKRVLPLGTMLQVAMEIFDNLPDKRSDEGEFDGNANRLRGRLNPSARLKHSR